MIIVPYEPNRNYDRLLEFIIHNTKNDFLLKGSTQEDDFLLLCCGVTGTGKSMLMLHIAEMYLEDKASIEYIGLDKSQHANALYKCKGSPLPRFCALDEANVSKRDHSSEYNKDLIDLYFSIRGLQIFHWWSNPSLNMIDKPFIEERIKGVIVILNKDIKRPRLYYYFTKESILKIYEQYDTLSLRLLKKVGSQYAYYRGWFKNYNGKLYDDYKSIKDKRMDNKVDIFHDKYAVKDGYIPFSHMMSVLGIARTTLKKYESQLIENGLFDKSKIKVSKTTGKKSYPPEFITAFEEYRSGIKNATKKTTKMD